MTTVMPEPTATTAVSAGKVGDRALMLLARLVYD